MDKITDSFSNPLNIRSGASGLDETVFLAEGVEFDPEKSQIYKDLLKLQLEIKKNPNQNKEVHLIINMFDVLLKRHFNARNINLLRSMGNIIKYENIKDIENKINDLIVENPNIIYIQLLGADFYGVIKDDIGRGQEILDSLAKRDLNSLSYLPIVVGDELKALKKDGDISSFGARRLYFFYPYIEQAYKSGLISLTESDMKKLNDFISKIDD